MAIRNASAVWNGTVKEGNGTMKLGSGAFEGEYTFASRFLALTGPELRVSAWLVQ